MSPTSRAAGAARSRATRLLPVILAATLVLGAGGVLSGDYGQTWDDSVEAFYGREVLKAYRGSQAYFSYSLQSYYGSGYYLIQTVTADALMRVMPDWTPVHARYFTNFMFYQLGVVSLYLILRRFLGPWASLGSTLVFYLQPLLLGHSFINHKDGTFLSFFLLALACGLSMADKILRNPVTRLPTKIATGGGVDPPAPQPRPVAFRRSWVGRRRLALGCVTLVIAVVLVDLLRHGVVHRALLSVVGQVYQGIAWRPIQSAFDHVAAARGVLPLGSYLAKTSKLYAVWRWPLIMLLLAADAYLVKRTFPALRVRGAAANAGWILLAGVTAGVATSVRIAGPFAALLVTVYLLYRCRRPRVGLVLLGYWGIALLALIGLWPALWRAPLAHLIDSLRIMAAFPAHDVLYLGEIFPSVDLPWHFFPVLVSLQLTEPLLILAAMGLVTLPLVWSRGAQEKKLLLGLASVWFAVPLIANTVFHVSNYGTIRHYLFALPALALFAGIPLDWAMQRLRRPAYKVALVAILVLPGLVSIVRLHPYEYVYFNSLRGGVRGAEGVFELDYWCTSYKEAMGFVNGVAPRSATVVVWGPTGAAQTYAREDLTVVPESPSVQGPEFALGCDSALRNPNFYATYSMVHTIERDGAMLAVVKSPASVPGR